MGLSMRLNKRVYLPYKPSEDFLEKTKETWDLIGVDPTTVDYVSTKFAEWSNAYSIFEWFLELSEYGWSGSVYVSYERIYLLKECVEEALENPEKKDNCITMSTDYGKNKKYFIEDLERTLEIANRAIDEIEREDSPTIEFEFEGGW